MPHGCYSLGETAAKQKMVRLVCAHPRAACGLPPHPPLWPARQLSAPAKHCASPSVAQRGSSATAPCGRRKRPSRRLDVPASVSVLQRTHVRHRSFRARSYPPIPRNRASPGHADRHPMISVLQPQARKICRLFRWFSTDHGEAQTTNTAACHVEPSMPPISAKYRPPHPPSYSSYASPPSQTAQLAACRTPVSPANAFKSP